MEDFASQAQMTVHSLPSPDSGSVQDSCDDACSICLEPFSAEDPATVTNCKHEYHLQCILEWSQRSKECPICWQSLVLKDPVSQELLAAVEIERNSRSRRRSSTASMFPRVPLEELGFHHVPSNVDESDFDDHIMQHLAAAALSRPHHLSRRERHRSSALAHSQFLVFSAPSNDPNIQQMPIAHPEETNDSSNSLSPDNTPSTASLSPTSGVQPWASPPLSGPSSGPGIADERQGSFSPRILAGQTPPGSPQRSTRSELLSFSESLKSRLSAASSRYKESISKSTKGFKEKLLARNNTVKELSKEVQREVTAGIAGVARMMERLDPISKRTGGFTSVSDATGGSSESSPHGKGVHENMIDSSLSKNCGDIAQGTSSNRSRVASETLSSGPEGHLGVAQDSLDVIAWGLRAILGGIDKNDLLGGNCTDDGEIIIKLTTAFSLAP